MTEEPLPPEALAALVARVQGDIAKYGWSDIGVFPTVDDPNSPRFNYSVGFTDLGHPELLVAGLPTDLAHTILWTLYERIVEESETFEAGDSASEVIRDFDVRFRAIPPDGRPLNMARAYYNVDELQALQVLWPDPQGKFPDEEGCESEYATAQDLDAIRR